MGVSIGSNISALVAQRLLSSNQTAQGRSLTRLSSGLRINSASDDAAGLSVATTLASQARVYTQAVRNANDGISALSIADGTLDQLTGIVTRLRELATGAANGTYGLSQRISSDKEAAALTDEFNRLAISTAFNGIKLTDGKLGELALQLGYGASERISAQIGSQLGRSVLADFSTSASSSLGTDPICAPEFADLNGDGKTDMVSSDDSGQLLAYLGNGDGTFQSGSTLGSGGFGLFSSAKIADFNGDGKLDVIEAAGNGLGSGGVYLSLGNGDGTFQAASVVAGGGVLKVAIGDLNGDGKTDILSSANGTGNISVRLGTGSGTFGGAIATGLSSNGSNLAIGDLNGDGVQDIVYGSASGISTALGRGNGNFQTAVLVSTASSIGNISLADVNNDGALDIAASNSSSVYSLLGLGTGRFGSTSTLGAGLDAKLVDANGDGKLDVFSRDNSGYIKIFVGDGAGGFGTSYTYQTNVGGFLGVADLNGDGVLDVSNGTDSFLATTQRTTTIQRLNLSTISTARSALDLLEGVANRLSLERGVLGSTQSRVAVGLSALFARTENYQAAEARITGADVAAESAELARRQIIGNIGAAILGQANQTPALALALLRS